MSEKSTGNIIRDVEMMHWKFSQDGGLRSLVAKMSPEIRKKFWEFRLAFLQEELTELGDASSADDAVDALIDLVVVAIGTLDAFGVGVRTAWSRVHDANMTKSVGANPTRPNEFGLPDLIKPEGWTPPNHEDNVGLIGQIYTKEM